MKIQIGHSRAASSSRSRLYLAVAGYGLVAGFLASLGISAIIMLAESVASLPSGTFYSVLALAIIPTLDQTSYYTGAIAFALHLLTGSIIGLGIAMIMILGVSTSRSASRFSSLNYAPVFGILAGLVLWITLFIPITFAVIVPVLSSHAGNYILSTHTLTGQSMTIPKSQLLSLINQITLSSLAFHLFYGMVTAIVVMSLYERRMRTAIIAK